MNIFNYDYSLTMAMKLSEITLLDLFIVMSAFVILEVILDHYLTFVFKRISIIIKDYKEKKKNV